MGSAVINKPYFCSIKQFILFILSSVLLLISLSDFKAQDPAYYTIGEEEFANADIYSLLFDENTEVLYIGTNSGVYAYRQNRFITVESNNDHIGNSFFNLRQNSKGEIFTSNMSGQIFQILDDRLELIYNPHESLRPFIKYSINQNDEMILVFGRSTIIKRNIRNEFISLIDRDIPLVVELDTIDVIQSFEQINGEFYISGTSQNESYVIYLDSTFNINKYWKCEISIENINQFVQQNNKVYGVNNDGVIMSFSDSLNIDITYQSKERIFSINDSSVIGLSSHAGFRYYILKHNNLGVTPLIFDDLFISAYTKLRNGTFLFGTFGEGIRLIPNPKILKHYHKELLLGIVSSPDNKVGISCRSGEIYELKNGCSILKDKVPHNVDNIYALPNNKKASSMGFQNFVYNDKRKGIEASLDVIEINKNTFITSSRNRILLYFNDSVSETNLAYKLTTDKSVYTIAESYRINSMVWYEEDSTFYFTSGNQFYKTRWDNRDLDLINISEINQSINDLFVDDKLIYCSTEREGILVYQIESDSIIFRLNTELGLLSNYVKQSEVQDGLLFTVGKKGFQVYDLINNKFINLGMKDGIAPENITKFSLSDNKVWLLEKHSYYSIDISDFIKGGNYVPLSILYLDSLLVNDSKIDIDSINEFDYTETAFTFYYDYRNLESKNDVQITYTLDGFYNDWKTVSVQDNKIEFESLPIGSYTFKIKAELGDQQSEIFTYQFEIFPPFWQTWWFYSLVLLGLLLIVIIYIRRRIAKVKKEELIKLEKQKMLTETIDSKLKALRSQMNPHFIFNSLNSIQALILRQDTGKSYDYVVMFADLVRKTLHYSEEDFINIEDELAFLDTYLKLESLRMKEEFSYEINYDGDKDVKIPSLMIQPFVENAIHHGLLHKEGEKRITIQFNFDTEVTCVIIDNGIGREKAREIKERQSSSHKSFSLEATKQRMKIIEEQTNKSFGYDIIDLSPVGTKVIVKIPFKHQF